MSSFHGFSVGLGKISHGLPWVSSFWLAVPQFQGLKNPTPVTIVTASPGSAQKTRTRRRTERAKCDDLCTKEGHEAMVKSSGMMGILCRASSLNGRILFRVILDHKKRVTSTSRFKAELSGI